MRLQVGLTFDFLRPSTNRDRRCFGQVALSSFEYGRHPVPPGVYEMGRLKGMAICCPDLVISPSFQVPPASSYVHVISTTRQAPKIVAMAVTSTCPAIDIRCSSAVGVDRCRPSSLLVERVLAKVRIGEDHVVFATWWGGGWVVLVPLCELQKKPCGSSGPSSLLP